MKGGRDHRYWEGERSKRIKKASAITKEWRRESQVRRVNSISNKAKSQSGHSAVLGGGGGPPVSQEKESAISWEIGSRWRGSRET